MKLRATPLTGTLTFRNSDFPVVELDVVPSTFLRCVLRFAESQKREARSRDDFNPEGQVVYRSVYQ